MSDLTQLQRDVDEWQQELERQRRCWELASDTHKESAKRLAEASRLLTHAGCGLEAAQAVLIAAKEKVAL